MYQASSAFHQAVANGNKQMALLIFDDAVFTNEDIDVDKGIEFNDYFNTEEDLCIGQVLSNEVSFALFNDFGLLNNYEFGDFVCTLGVQIGTGYYRHDRNVVIETGSAKYIGMSTAPYLTRNGNGLSPGFAVHSLLAYNGKIYAFGRNQEYAVFSDATGANITGSNPMNSFMRHKSLGWIGRGFVYANRILTIYQNGQKEIYEFVPLGTFTADRPNVPDVIRIEFHCYDLMQKLDKDMPSAAELGITYPCLVGTLFEAICNYFGVPYKDEAFINSYAELDEEPEEFENSSARTVIGWIAEAAGSNARFNRDGILIMDWIRSSGVNVDEHGYSEFRPYWYETEPVTQIKNRSTNRGEDIDIGSGNGEYLIQDNPILNLWVDEKYTGEDDEDEDEDDDGE